MRRLLSLLGLLSLACITLSSMPDVPSDAAGLHHIRPRSVDCTGKDGVTAQRMREAQREWAKFLGCKVEETVEIDKGITMTFVLVPPGKFKMGSPAVEKNRDKDETLHTVTLTEPFYLGKYEVTQTQYEALIGKNPSHFKGSILPVEMVTWDEARDYAVKLTTKRGDKQTYRLPTEAEWEYACRGGHPSSMPFGVGDGKSLSSLQANFHGNYPYGDALKGPYLGKTCPVGSYAANALGLHDMHGNVWERCADWYGPYPERHVSNPSGPSKGSNPVVRGGGWDPEAWWCRAAGRSASGGLGVGDSCTGFRLARSARSAKK